jgi:vWA-MoxR associated protein C-terminal domain/Effector-associated domain 1
MIDWDDNTNRKEFRAALQRRYPNESDLRIFVDEELNENLAVIASGNLSATAYDLIVWARARGRLDEVFEAFRNQNPNDAAIAILQTKPLVQKAAKLSEQDWESLFTQFSVNDFADLQRAFLRGVQQTFKWTFQEMRPGESLPVDGSQIRELLTQFDQPELAAQFVEVAIAELRRSSEGTRDVTGLEQWRDRVAQEHGVLPLTPQSQPEPAQRGYLLIAVEESGADVIVYPELRVSGEESAIEFGVSPVTCSFAEIPNYLPLWIKQAEETLMGKCEYQGMLLELFLPCAFLEEDLATTWEIKDKRDRLISLGLQQTFMVRSFDRIRDKGVRRELEQKWKLLKQCVSEGNACDKFLLQKSCLKQGALQVLLKNKPGLKLVTQLPSERSDRQDLLYDVIDAAVPVAFWSPSIDEASLAELETQIHELSRASHLTDFASLASNWQTKLAESAIESVKHIRLLCDSPDRFPNLPDPDREEDLLVAS